LTAVNVLVPVARFPLMRHWVFRSPNLLTTPPAGSSIRLTKENSR
jgi:hypothetical protein